MCVRCIYIWYEYTYVQELVCGVYVWECMCVLVWCLCVCEYILEHKLFCVCMMCACVRVYVCAVYVSEYMCVHVFMFVNSCVCACFNISLLVTPNIVKNQAWSYVNVYCNLQETIRLFP